MIVNYWTPNLNLIVFSRVTNKFQTKIRCGSSSWWWLSLWFCSYGPDYRNLSYPRPYGPIGTRRSFLNLFQNA